MYNKSLINNQETCVTDNLMGYVMQHRSLSLIPESNIVIRADLNSSITSGKVQLLSGNGSGHEPGLYGYVGKGMLSGCVMGQIFTSPPPHHILTALRLMNNPAGVLSMVANYTGDRLNFGLATEQAQLQGLSGVEMIVMGEDSAITSPSKSAGRRGLAGIILAIKVAGAMAEEGSSLAEIKACLELLQMGTIGIATSSCSLPNKGPLFPIKFNQFELGIGVHGEAGAAKVETTTARDAARLMVDHMTLKDSKSRLNLNPGDQVALLVNNLGGLSNLEYNIMVKEVLQYLGELKVQVVRLYSSHYFCSLNMAGLSISLLHLTPAILRCLDAPCEAPAWNAGLTQSILPDYTLPASISSVPPSKPDLEEEDFSTTAKLSSFGEKLLTTVVGRVCLVMNNCERMLNQMDQGGGDGDTGSTLSRGATAILQELEAGQLRTSYPRPFLLRLAWLCSAHMGGTSGAIYSLLLTGMASGFSKPVSSYWLVAWCTGLEAGLASICKYGQAALGDRTMLDALIPYHQALQTSHGKEDSWQDILAVLEKAAKEAEAGAQKTAKMEAHAGRASYVKSMQLSQPDPGAQAIANTARAIYETVKQYVGQPLKSVEPDTITIIAD